MMTIEDQTVVVSWLRHVVTEHETFSLKSFT